ncbi:hypothetical protein V5O48_011650 [Marasmius crinis-equi]|uniref:PB1 domain-containing protein n=1 Tax=Marasmius crinis-equi TaxID=585013 RepID=A0ABR3F505_9AGAR
MNPNATQFKLTHADQTRRAFFQARPTWLALSDKIHTLFDIPLNKVAVSYFDAEEDEVTLSTPEELQDFYQDLDMGGIWKPGDVIKVTVLDLGSARSRSSKSLPTTPRSNLRNTFGGNLSDGLPFNIDEDWQHFPPFGSAYMPGNPQAPGPDGSPHAFIEVLGSDVSAAKDSPPSSVTSSARTPTPRLDKGKGRALDVEEEEEIEVGGLAEEDDDVSSIASVIASENQGKKPDIHVLGRQASSGIFELSKSRGSQASRTSRESRSRHSSRHSSVVAAPIALASTPKSSLREVSARSASNVSIPPSSIPVARTVESLAPSEDPPLPPLDNASLEEAALDEQGRAKPSLSTDIAHLLATLTAVIASHPELSERIRSILQNAAAGSYWTRPGQRDSIQSFHEAAESVAGGLTTLDDEAGKKVAEALGDLFRTVGQVVGTPPAANGRSIPSAAPNTSPSDSRAPHRTSVDNWSRPGYTSYNSGYGWNAPPPPGPPPPPGGYAPQPPPAPRDGLYGYHRGPEGPPLHHIPVRDLATGNRSFRRPKKHSRDLRAQVEAAKLLYKAEKERYRADREERRQDKEERERRLIEMYASRGDMSHEQTQTPLANNSMTKPAPIPTIPSPPQAPAPVVPPLPAEPPQMTSIGHGRYPSFEITRVPSAPHRSNSLRRSSDTASRRVSAQETDPKERSLKRIINKLADMGFTTRAHPDLPSRISVMLPSDITTMTADKEDGIATDLVHEMLKPPMNKIPPMPSGSGVP